MDCKLIKQGLSTLPDIKVDIFLQYVKELERDKDREGKPKHAWLQYVKEQELIDIFTRVASKGLFIDGDSVSLGYRGKLMPVYNYQAYKNLLLIAYPETMIDLQVVYANDPSPTFRKESGKVIYTHEFGDPFDVMRSPIGAYCVIKNRRGEFLETINLDDIDKMKKVAKTQNIWNEWFSEMVKKSIIKRACKTHFKDEVQVIDREDNEVENDLDRLSLSDVQNNLLERVEALPVTKIKDGTRAELIRRIKLPEFEKLKDKITTYIKELENGKI